MAASRVKKSIKNVSYGLITQAITIALNFAARVILVHILGMEANGLNGLFTEVIAMLSLAELGVSSAITYSLYKPLADGDDDKLSQLMWLFRVAYRVIAAVILAMGLILTPFIQMIVRETGYSVSYIRLIFILFVIKTASTYLFSYKTALLMADQKNYIVSNITTVCHGIMVLMNIVVLITMKSFVAYLIVMIVFSVITNICISVYAGKHYPFLKNSKRLPREEYGKIMLNIRHIFIGKLSSKITNSTDNILISALVSTVSTGIYSNYSLITTNIKQIFAQMMNAMTGSMGNLLVSEKPEYCAQVMKRLTFMFFAAGLVFGGGMISASQPFIEMFFGAKSLLDTLNLFVCAFNLYLFIWINPLWYVMGISGLFSEDKKTSIVGSVINLIVSVILGKKIGMAGIFIGTTCTFLIQIFWKISLLFNRRFNMSGRGYTFETIKMMLIALITLTAELYICSLIALPSLFAAFIVRGAVSVIISAGVILSFYGRSSEFAYFKGFIERKLRQDREE